MTKKQKIFNIARQIITCLAAISLCLGVWALGLFFSDEILASTSRSVWVALSIASSATIFLIGILNCVLPRLLLGTLSAIKIRTGQEWGDKIKSDVESNLKRAEKSVNTVILLAYTYLVFLIALALLCCFCIGILLTDGQQLYAALTLGILFVFMNWGLLETLCTPAEDQSPTEE